MKRFLLYLATMALLAPMTACDDDDEPNIKKEWNDDEVPQRTAPDFAKGCDPSWVTAMEDANWTFRDTEGNAGDCLEILKNVGFDACRLRVWVNPSDDYCNTADMVRKAVRAYNLGYSIMVDFHYSDSWADPSQQYKPSIWDDCESVSEMADKLYAYTKKVLSAVRTNGVDVAWVQIGNETLGGMLKTNSDGSETDVNGNIGANYVTLHAAGCKAAKEVYPNCKTVVHFENGQKLSSLQWLLNRLTSAGIDFDILGVSLYPDFSDADWYANYIDAAVSNLNTIHNAYGCDVMICELGCDISNENADKAIVDAVKRCKSEVPSCKGVFYWEPECYDSGTGAWNGYTKGAFTSTGEPSSILVNAFGN